MKILGKEFFTKRKKLKEKQATLDQVKAPIAKTISIAKIPRIRNPSLSFRARTGINEFEQPEYDLAEIGRIEDVESYARRAFGLQEGLMFKAGWELVGAEPRAIIYIKERFRQMDQATGLSHRLLFRGIGADLVRFSNSFLVKVRKLEASGGKQRQVPGKKNPLEPVAGYFSIPPTTIRIKRDVHGHVTQYMQELPSGAWKKFAPDRVIHFYIDKKKGFLVGTPSLVPVKDDIRALRRIEENIELLVYQCLFPLFHYTVGTETAPAATYPDGTTEVDVLKAQIEDMPSEGAIVTPERHEVKAIGAEGRALRAEGYLEHFKKRVFSGLGVSAVDFGEGSTANRSCYSEDTQTLTDSGFKYYWEITGEDKIATFNPKTNQLEFHKPRGSILLYNYQGSMYHFKNRNIDTLVTPDHDMWMGRPLWNRSSWEKIHAEDIDVANYKFLSGGLQWKGTEPEDFLLPYVPYNPQINHSNVGPTPRIEIEDWLEFLGYYVSEGCLVKAQGKWALTLSQNSVVNADRTRKMRACLDRLPFKYNEYTNPTDKTTRFWINSKSLYLYLQENCKDYSYLKRLPPQVLTYNDRLLRIVFEAAMLGDGTTDIRQGRTSRTYYSTSEVLTDQIQEIALKLGYRANILPGAGCYRVCMSERVTANVMSKQVEVIPYNGKVYCFNVPNHLFITRRNGRIGIHGNTADNMSRNLVDLVKAQQKELEVFINEYIIKELLLESTFPDPLASENLVEVKFNEIDLDAQIKVENHSVNAFSGHAITHSELRKVFGKEPFTEDQEKDTYWKKYEEPKLLIAATDEPYSAIAKAVARSQTTGVEQGDLDTEATERKKEAEAQAKAKAAGKPGPASTKKPGGQRAAKAADQPSNQHGKKLSPEKRKSSFGFVDMVGKGNRITAAFDDLLDNTLRAIEFNYYNENWFASTARAVSTLMQGRLLPSLRLTYREGFRSSGAVDLYLHESFSFSNIENRLMRLVNRLINRLINVIRVQIDTNDSVDVRKLKVINVFDALRFRSRFIFNSEMNKALNYGIAQGLRTLGRKEANVHVRADACDECKSHTKTVSLEHILMEDLPGFHTNCNCSLETQ